MTFRSVSASSQDHFIDELEVAAIQTEWIDDRPHRVRRPTPMLAPKSENSFLPSQICLMSDGIAVGRRVYVSVVPHAYGSVRHKPYDIEA